MSGPAPTPTPVLKMRDSWRANIRKGEPRPAGDAPECPDWLDKPAARIWHETVEHLRSMQTLAETDQVVIAAFSQSYADYAVLVVQIRNEGRTFETPKGYIAKNPAVTMMNEARSAMLKLAAELGLSPASRTRIRVPEKRKKDDKDRFFKRAR